MPTIGTSMHFPLVNTSPLKLFNIDCDAILGNIEQSKPSGKCVVVNMVLPCQVSILLAIRFSIQVVLVENVNDEQL